MDSVTSVNKGDLTTMGNSLRIGLDFDNTIVCYDKLFSRVAREQDLVPPDTDETKSAIRDYLRKDDREDEWTRLQGYVYGARMAEAEAFPGALNFFRGCNSSRWTLFIISHKTKSPYLGPHYDLHQSALDWINNQGLCDSDRTGLSSERVFFELTKDAKMERIAEMRCSIFLDDLPEFLAEPAFPAGVRRILFDPGNAYPDEKRFTRVSSWADFSQLINQRAGTDG